MSETRKFHPGELTNTNKKEKRRREEKRRKKKHSLDTNTGKRMAIHDQVWFCGTLEEEKLCQRKEPIGVGKSKREKRKREEKKREGKRKRKRGKK